MTFHEAVGHVIDVLRDLDIRYVLVGAEALRRANDREDARGVIAVEGDRLDWVYIHRWCDAHHTRGLLDEIRGSIA